MNTKEFLMNTGVNIYDSSMQAGYRRLRIRRRILRSKAFSIPAGWYVVKTGNIQAGDLTWNRIENKWDDPVSGLTARVEDKYVLIREYEDIGLDLEGSY